MPILPALVSVLVIIISRRVVLALFLGGFTGALIHANFIPLNTIVTFWHYILATLTDKIKVEIALFTIGVGGILNFVSESGAYHTYASVLGQYIKTKRKTRILGWFLGFFFFFDDVANVLITGSSVKPIFDKRHVPSITLAYFTDTVASIASFTLVSTWAAFEISLMQGAGSSYYNVDFTKVFIDSFPFHFYTILSIILAGIVAYTGAWLYRGKLKTEIHDKYHPIQLDSNIRITHALFPFVYMVVICVGGIFILGYYFAKKQGLELSLPNILGASPTIDILLFSVVFSLLASFYYYINTKVFTIRKASIVVLRGFKSMFSTAMIIIAASILAQASKSVNTGAYISSFVQNIHGVEVPIFIFILSTIITIATGSSWSTMAIIMPVAFKISFDAGSDITIVVASLISGSIAGAQLVPYSDKCIIAATSARVSPLYHVKTQLPHVVVSSIVSIFTLYIYYYSQSLLISYLIGILLLSFVFFLFKKSYMPSEEQRELTD